MSEMPVFAVATLGFFAGWVTMLVLLPCGSHLGHFRLRTQHFDLELVVGYGLSPGARVRFGERIRERREQALSSSCEGCEEEGT